MPGTIAVHDPARELEISQFRVKRNDIGTTEPMPAIDKPGEEYGSENCASRVLRHWKIMSLVEARRAIAN